MYSSRFAGWLILFGGRWWKTGEVLFERRDVGMIGGQRGLQNGEGLLVKRAGLVKPPLILNHQREVVDPFNRFAASSYEGADIAPPQFMSRGDPSHVYSVDFTTIKIGSWTKPLARHWRLWWSFYFLI
jgi:hypothetical protein